MLDVVSSIKFFFVLGFIQPGLNSNFMMLLPNEMNVVDRLAGIANRIFFGQFSF